jgi:hypothetical protein
MGNLEKEKPYHELPHIVPGPLHEDWSETTEDESPIDLKEKALKIIQKIYEKAGKIKASPLNYGTRSDHFAAEEHQLTIAEGMQGLAVGLGILTKKEAEELKNNYWANRDKIPLDIPDRF